MKIQQKTGFVLTFVMTLIVIATVIASAFLFSARNSFKTVEQWRNYNESMLGLQSGLETFRHQMDQRVFSNYATNKQWACLQSLDTAGYATNSVWTNIYGSQVYTTTVAITVNAATTTFHSASNTAEIFLRYTASNTYAGVTRRVTEVVSYRWGPAGTNSGSVFDNAYFIDAHATFNGVNADFNGDVWINGDIDLRSTGSFHGNGDMKATGEIPLTYNYDSWAQYANGVTDARRPMSNTMGGSNTNYDWPMGYSGAPQRYPNQTPPTMPYIGPLSQYEAYAIATTGTLVMGTTTVNAVWGDTTNENSRLGINNSYDTGNLVITNGATIHGIVVARGDVYIKGKISGQGTIYAGRNIYVIGDITYSNAPAWPHPDSNPRGTAAANKSKDFLGLCAKGNVMIGSFILKKTDGNVDLLFGPAHASDPSDLSLGYVSSVAEDGTSTFNGNYEAVDGQNGSGKRTDGTARSFYAPTLDGTYFGKLNADAKPGHMDAVLYANHMIAGYPLNAVINGSVVCSDEFYTRNGNLTFNWDARLGTRSLDGMDFKSGLPSLPGVVSRDVIFHWSEVK